MKKSLPGDARDWKMLWDEDIINYLVHFPQHIYNTAERPVILVWSDSSRQVVFSVPLSLPLLQRVIDFGAVLEFGLERVIVYIFLYSRNAIQSQSLQ